MSILEIELTPDIARQLEEKAKQSGLEAKAYVQTMVIHDLQGEASGQTKRSILELEGLGADLWRDEHGALVDAQTYVNELRQE